MTTDQHRIAESACTAAVMAVFVIVWGVIVWRRSRDNPMHYRQLLREAAAAFGFDATTGYGIKEVPSAEKAAAMIGNMIRPLVVEAAMHDVAVAIEKAAVAGTTSFEVCLYRHGLTDVECREVRRRLRELGYTLSSSTLLTGSKKAVATHERTIRAAILPRASKTNKDTK